MDSYLENFLSGHAISKEIGGRGRYVHYERGDFDLVVPFFSSFGDDKLERWARNVVGQVEGLVIRRAGWEQDIPPQLRPENPVAGISKPMLSFHPDDRSVKWGSYTNQKGKRSSVRALPERQRPAHLAKWHLDGNVNEPHCHFPVAKYAIPPGAHGKRLDVQLPDRIVRSERVFFAIEGSVKTDAILSTGAAAFGVPSVTLWRAGGGAGSLIAPELDAFIIAMDLRDKQVVVVPDADWVEKPLVIAQALMLRTYLRDSGVDAIVAAPPLVDGKVEVVGGKELKGVDDYLAAGRSLEDLSVIKREACDKSVALHAFYSYCYRSASRCDSRQAYRVAQALTHLPLYADGEGRVVKSLKAFGAILGRGRKEVGRTIEVLERAGVIEVEGSLEADYQYPDPHTGEMHDYDWTKVDWDGDGHEDLPRITFAAEFRAVEQHAPLSALPIPTAKPTKSREAEFVRI